VLDIPKISSSCKKVLTTHNSWAKVEMSSGPEIIPNAINAFCRWLSLARAFISALATTLKIYLSLGVVRERCGGQTSTRFG
jgi:hypothetical protein